MRVALPCSIEVTTRLPNQRFISQIGWDVLDRDNCLAPKTGVRQRLNSPAEASGILPAHLGSLSQPPHARLHITIRELDVCEHPQQVRT